MDTQKYFDLLEYEAISGGYKNFRIEIVLGKKIKAFDGKREIASSDFGTKHTSYKRGAINLLTAIRIETTINTARAFADPVAKQIKGMVPDDIVKWGKLIKSAVKKTFDR